MKKSIWNVMLVSMVLVMLGTVSIGHTPEVIDYATAIDNIPSAIVWSDNFDDENISDWQLFAVNRTLPEPLLPGNATAEGGVLRHNQMNWTYAGHNSSVAFGTWTFDLDIQEPLDVEEILILFVSEPWNYDWPSIGHAGESYALTFIFNPSGVTISLVKASHDTGNIIMDNDFFEDLTGWKSFIITRELSGQFYVYMNGNLILKGKNLHHTTSERFYFTSFGGPAIDNVSVSDTIDYDKAPPEWDPEIPNMQILEGEAFYYDVNATDYSGIDKWWIDDTENFTIDENGVFTNNTALTVGEYIVSLYVNDTLGNTQGDLFALTVNPATTTTTPTPTDTIPTSPTTTGGLMIPLELIVAVGGGLVVIIIVLVIWRTRK